MQIEKFNPTRAEILSVVDRAKNLTIKDVDDEDGYIAVKVAKTELSTYRIQIAKFGKKQREEALAWQREVLHQEKELLAMIEPTETKLRAYLNQFDEYKKREERKILLPARDKMLQEIGISLFADQILKMDEKEFSAFYSERKMEFLERKAEVEREARETAERVAEIERIKKETAERAVIEERERVEREKTKAAKKQEQVIAAEKEDQAKTEKNRKYKAWLKKNGFTGEDEFYIKHTIFNDRNVFELFKKIDEITIK